MTSTQMSYVPFTPPDGLTAKQEEDLLKSSFASVTTGAAAEVPERLGDGYDYALEQLAYWQEQVLLIRNQMRRHLGNAEVVTCRGVVKATRRIFTRAGYVVPPTEVDAIYPTNRR